jgi:hypothetical protein
MINGISFGNKVQYVHDGAIFAEKEVEEVARNIAKALEHDRTMNVLDDAADIASRNFVRYDRPILQPAVDTSREISYAISHGHVQGGKTIAIV